VEAEEEWKPDWQKSGSPVEAHPSAVGGGSYGGSQWKSSRSSSEAQEMVEAGSLFKPKEWHPKVPLQAIHLNWLHNSFRHPHLLSQL